MNTAQIMPEVKLKHFVAKGDVEYLLTPLVDSMLAHGLTQTQVLDAVIESTKRVMKLSLSEAGVRLSVDELEQEAQSVSIKLIDRLTVKDAAAVSPVAKRHGLPAALAVA